MKGTIAVCLEELVRQKFGDEAWQTICKAGGLPDDHRFKATGDVPDGDVLALIDVAAKELGITTEQAYHAFGIHWSTAYAPRIYGHFFKRAKNARDFLLGMDKVHTMVTKTVRNARPPKFHYDDSNPAGLVMTYDSPRGLAALMPGLVEGVAQHFGEEIHLKKVGNAIHIDFLAAEYRKAA